MTRPSSPLTMLLSRHTRRRAFITLIGGAAGWPLVARAQQTGRVYRVALVFTTSPVSEMAGPDPIHPLARSFVQGLAALGYLQGQNLALEPRSAEGKFERFPAIIRELVALKVDVVVTVANPLTQAAKEVTTTVPIVMAYSVSPVEHGMVQSLNLPGGNVTGLAMNVGTEIPGKQLQLLKELLPRISRVAFLHSKEQEAEGVQIGEAAAQKLGITLLPAEHTPTDYTDAFAFITREHPDALVVGASAVNVANRHLIVDFASRMRLPAMYATREFVSIGGLISYGVDFHDLFRRAAGYVDRILRGAKPADIPVEQPAKFALVINIKTAKSLGLDMPDKVLALADEIVE
jgi:putative tryptophan/tyrosine transport system substrate-binding protein